jgi:hypothetical protein
MSLRLLLLVLAVAPLSAQDATEVTGHSQIIGAVPAGWTVRAVGRETQTIHAGGVTFIVPVYRLAPDDQKSPVFIRDPGVAESLASQATVFTQAADWAEQISRLLKTASESPIVSTNSRVSVRR